MRFSVYLYLTLGLLDSILNTMKIIDRYFTKQLLGVFIMLLLVLTGLAWMVQIISMMKFLMNYGVNLGSFLGLTTMMVPFIISIILPFVVFIAVLFVYNKMISDNEVTVWVASGCAPKRLARPALFFAGILTVLHLVLNLWIVPASQALFYDTQWNLRYGLAHLKLQESAFTEMANGLVVYVDNVSGHSLNQLMLSDTRKESSQMVIFAKQGELVTTVRGLSIVMKDGSLLAQGNSVITGTFESFDMDLSISEKNTENAFRVRRLSTPTLIRSLFETLSAKQHKNVARELCTRFVGPVMNFILAALCCLILLRSSLLRRRTSFAPAFAVVAMSMVMAAFMSVSNMLTGGTDLLLLSGGVLVVTFVVLGLLLKK